MVLIADAKNAVLHTGDFRYRQLLVDQVKQVLLERSLTTIYLDNTFATTSETFPSQQEAYSMLL
jgi:hypothetical protein